MYHVMIVDDEEPVLDSFSYIMEQGVDKFELCGKARSGKEAVQKALTLKPDLIFMDIQMPGMDGMEAISQIKKSNDDTVFILATAYERFDIARKAIRLNVLSYLVKPVTRKKILEELERAGEFLDRRMDERKQALDWGTSRESQIRKRESDFVRSLNGTITAQEWDEIKEELGFSSDRGALFVLDLDSDSSAGEKQTHFNRLKERILFKYLCYLSFSGERALLFFPEESDLGDLYSRIKELLRDMNLTCRIGQGGIYPLEEMMLSYEEAMEPFLLDNSNARLFEQEQISRILTLAERGEKEDFIQDMCYLAESIFTSRSFRIALGEMTSVFALVLGRLGYFNRSQSGVMPLLPAEEIMPLENKNEWDAWFHHGLEKLTAVMKEAGEEDLPELLQKALEHIRGHYSDQIYLGSVAQACGVSASYLSRLFSEHMDSPFTDYLNRYRVDRALLLLKEDRISVKEASFRTGFSDPNYFSKIFRKYKGISPSEV